MERERERERAIHRTEILSLLFHFRSFLISYFLFLFFSGSMNGPISQVHLPEFSLYRFIGSCYYAGTGTGTGVYI